MDLPCTYLRATVRLYTRARAHTQTNRVQSSVYFPLRYLAKAIHCISALASMFAHSTFASRTAYRESCGDSGAASIKDCDHDPANLPSTPLINLVSREFAPAMRLVSMSTNEF